MNHDLWFSLTTYVFKTTTVRSSFVDMMEADYKKVAWPSKKHTHMDWFIDQMKLVLCYFFYTIAVFQVTSAQSTESHLAQPLMLPWATSLLKRTGIQMQSTCDRLLLIFF